MSQLDEDIVRFNAMYGLPVATYPTTKFLPVVGRMEKFKKILLDEVNEVDDIVKAVQEGASELEVLTMLADWLGDLQVYAASEMAKYGLPREAVLKTIMQSNFSKLGADGKAIIVDGKVQKGPNYFKPEPAIKLLLESQID